MAASIKKFEKKQKDRDKAQERYEACLAKHPDNPNKCKGEKKKFDNALADMKSIAQQLVALGIFSSADLARIGLKTGTPASGSAPVRTTSGTNLQFRPSEQSDGAASTSGGWGTSVLGIGLAVLVVAGGYVTYRRWPRA